MGIPNRNCNCNWSGTLPLNHLFPNFLMSTSVWVLRTHFRLARRQGPGPVKPSGNGSGHKKVGEEILKQAPPLHRHHLGTRSGPLDASGSYVASTGAPSPSWTRSPVWCALRRSRPVFDGVLRRRPGERWGRNSEQL